MMYTLASFKDNKVTALITFDAITSLEEKWSANVTTQVVEKGFNISDSVTVEPPTFSIKGIVTSYSIFDMRGEITWVNGAFVPRDYKTEERHITSRNKLIDLISSGGVVTILESKEVYIDSDDTVAYTQTAVSKVREIEDCVITSLILSQPDSASGAIDISLELQRVMLATVDSKALEPNEVQPTLIPYYSPATQSGSGGSGKTSKAEDGGEGGFNNTDIEDAVSVSDAAEGPKGDSAEKAKYIREKNARIRKNDELAVMYQSAINDLNTGGDGKLRKTNLGPFAPR